jgi:5'-nucleotidase
VKRSFGSIATCALALLGIVASVQAHGGSAPEPLHILVTNDDGFASPGIQALRGALLARGYEVTVVAPLENQSGSGGSLDTDVGSFVDVIEESPGVWSVASTPGDSVRAALGAVLADDPPDLVISGLNFGQNLAQPGSNSSGTVGAALTALYAGLPAIAASVGIDLSEANETPLPFPSTFAAFGPAADFVARAVERLQKSSVGGRILPPRTLLNINFPVPYGEIRGVRPTRLATEGDLDFVWEDVLDVIPSGGGPVLISVALPQGPDPVPHNDADAYREGFVSITPMDGDMTAGPLARWSLAVRLAGLQP